MSDDDGDGIWTLTIDPQVVGDYQFKYTINGWSAEETVPGECATSNNRAFTVDGDDAGCR